VARTGPAHASASVTSSRSKPSLPRRDVELPLSLHHRLDNNNECYRLDGSDLVRLNGSSTLTLQQGQSYEELGLLLHWKARALQGQAASTYSASYVVNTGATAVDINPVKGAVEQSSSGNMFRGLYVRYPFPHGSYLTELGIFSIKYDVSAPWLSPAVTTVSLTRTLVVTDVNECTYTGNVPAFVHNCDPLAFCVNTEGSYHCVCPEGFAGEGRRVDGQGCRDVSPPVLRCRGAGCTGIRFTFFNYSGLVGNNMQQPQDHSTHHALLKLPFDGSPGSGLGVEALRAFLEENKYSACGIKKRFNSVNGTSRVIDEDGGCFYAFDRAPAIRTQPSLLRSRPPPPIPLTSNVRMGNVELVGPLSMFQQGDEVSDTMLVPTGWRFKVLCRVKDAAGERREHLPSRQTDECAVFFSVQRILYYSLLLQETKPSP